MPEGPELFLASIFINAISRDRLYGGCVIKSEVSTKNPDVNWNCDVYRISAVARGKELKLTLTEGDEHTKNGKTLDILFRFGMSGSFKFTPTAELPKHAHLRFFTISGDQPKVLSFVDYRRFGRWEVGVDWGRDRGPDPMWEYQCFRENVLVNLYLAAFKKPICEVMLNQKFFNGIGNYLRAEILYRCQVRPFDEARKVLSELNPFSEWYDAKIKQMEVSKVKIENGVLEEKPHDSGVQPDLLDLCHILPKEVINLDGGGKGYKVDPDADEEEYAAFRAWLRCYYNKDMKNLVDHNKRTIWFSGDPGELLPKDPSSRSLGERKRKPEKKNQATKSSVSKKNKSDAKRNQEIVTEKENPTKNKVKRKGATPKARSSKTKTVCQKASALPKATEDSVKQEEAIQPSKRRSSTNEINGTPLRRSSRRSSSV